jgi:hypothetical protein
MCLFASRRSGRHAQGRRITAGPTPTTRRIEPVVSLLGKPDSRSGTPTFRALAFSEAAQISCRSNVDNQKSVLICRGPPNTALSSGQHGAAKGAIR